MSFDLSVHDMFLCWRHGACLYSVPAKAAHGAGSHPAESAYMLVLGPVHSRMHAANENA